MPRKERTGVVVSDAMNKTVIVMVERTVSHRRYKKILRRRKRFHAHDETNVCRLGDRVLIEECRPLSKHKHWRVIRILARHEVAEVRPDEIQASALEASSAGDGEMAAVTPNKEKLEPVPVVKDETKDEVDEDGEVHA